MLNNKVSPVWYRAVILWSSLNMLVSAVFGPLWLLDWPNRPFDLLATVLHELGHAIPCILTGGEVGKIGLGDYGDGVTTCLGGCQLLYAQTGYLMVPFVSALLLRVLRYRADARLLLVGMGLAIGLAQLLFFRDRVSCAWGSLIAAALIFSGLRCQAATGRLLVKLVVVELLVNCADDFVVLARFASGLFGSHETDATYLAATTGLPAMFFCISWMTLSLWILSVVPGRRPAASAALEPSLRSWRLRRPAPAIEHGDEPGELQAA